MMSKQLIELRKQKGLSQEDLAYKIGVSRQAVSKWETDQGYPDTERLMSLVKFYDTSADYILFGKTTDSKEKSIWKDKNFVKALVFFTAIISILSISTMIVLFFIF